MQRNTLGGKRYLPSSVYMNAQMPTIGQICSLGLIAVDGYGIMGIIISLGALLHTFLHRTYSLLTWLSCK